MKPPEFHRRCWNSGWTWLKTPSLSKHDIQWTSLKKLPGNFKAPPEYEYTMWKPAWSVSTSSCDKLGTWRPPERSLLWPVELGRNSVNTSVTQSAPALTFPLTQDGLFDQSCPRSPTRRPRHGDDPRDLHDLSWCTREHSWDGSWRNQVGTFQWFQKPITMYFNWTF